MYQKDNIVIQVLRLHYINFLYCNILRIGNNQDYILVNLLYSNIYKDLDKSFFFMTSLSKENTDNGLHSL